MKRFFTLGSLPAILAFAVVFAAVPGCPPAKDKPIDNPKAGGDKAGNVNKDKKKDEPLTVKAYDGVITGKVIYDGTPPTMAPIAAMKGHGDETQCMAGPHNDQTWIIDADKGVANVVVSLEVPKGKFFAIDEKLADKYKAPVSINQKFCVYEPHIAAIFPEYRGEDGKLHSSAQTLLVKNTGAISHNTIITGNPQFNDLWDKSLNPGEEKGIAPEIKYQAEPLAISCKKHPWMSGMLFTFNHPFFAVTNDKGEFTIKNVPVGVEVTVKLWHEKAAAITETHTFKTGDNALPPTKIKAE